MKRLALAVVGGTMALNLTGCMYHIKLDPNDDNARVYINGVPRGRGITDHAVDAQYGHPGQFGVKVEPQEGKPYSVEIKRELDFPRALIQTTVSAGLGLAYTAYDYYNYRVPLTGLILLAYAPLSWLSSYYFKPYYDLPKEEQKLDGK